MPSSLQYCSSLWQYWRGNDLEKKKKEGQQGAAGNIEVLETVRIANNKYIQLVRIGESYFAIAVCKDTVTNLGEIPAGQLKDKTTTDNTSGFRELLKRAAKKENEEQDH